MSSYRLTLAAALASMLPASFANTADTADQPHREIIKKDLFAVITLNGQACDEVVDYKTVAAMQYVAVCKNGKRYRVGVTPEGRVKTSDHAD